MTTERKDRDSEILARLPADVFEQIRFLPRIDERERICVAISKRLATALKDNGVKIEDVETRAKQADSIEDKIKRRGSTNPLRDIYRVRFITNYPDRSRVARIIQDSFPLTPKVFPDGMPSVRDYANPETREFVKSRFNPRISDRHSAMNVNIVFLRNGSRLCDIAEIQVLTTEEMALYKETRSEYENGNKK
jgi:hypothetical protein